VSQETIFELLIQSVSRWAPRETLLITKR